ncbi:hypothetical protein V2G26_021302 [Clonostachys chloroleuca]
MVSSTAGKHRVLIVGAGAFGVSTALHLQKYCHQYVDVMLLDSQPFPSVDSASGNDTSRQIRMDYTDPFYAELAIEAIHAWSSDPIFKDHFKQCGRVGAVAPGSPYLQKCRETMKALGVNIVEFPEDNKVEGLKKKFPHLGNAQKLKGWDFYYNPYDGWANPHDAIKSAMKEYQAVGGVFIGNPEKGLVVENVLELEDSTTAIRAAGARIVGVRTADGLVHCADRVIYATGSLATYKTNLIPSLGTQIHPTGFAIAHWKLEDAAEVKSWQNHPVVDAYHHGYFFPPDPNGLMKLGLGIMAFTHDRTSKQGTPDVGIARLNSALVGSPDDGRIPTIAENGIRWVLGQWAPSLAKKKFFSMKICWDAMTPDGGWLIDDHPDIEGLSVAIGGSGHGFKFLPVVGQYICETLDISGAAKESEMPKSSDQRRDAMKEKWKWGRLANLGVKDRRIPVQGRPILDVVRYMPPVDIEGIIHSKI